MWYTLIQYTSTKIFDLVYYSVHNYIKVTVLLFPCKTKCSGKTKLLNHLSDSRFGKYCDRLPGFPTSCGTDPADLRGLLLPS